MGTRLIMSVRRAVYHATEARRLHAIVIPYALRGIRKDRIKVSRKPGSDVVKLTRPDYILQVRATMGSTWQGERCNCARMSSAIGKTSLTDYLQTATGLSRTSQAKTPTMQQEWKGALRFGGHAAGTFLVASASRVPSRPIGLPRLALPATARQSAPTTTSADIRGVLSSAQI